MTLLGVQQRLVELGRIRVGEKGPKGEPRRLTHFRLTSASRPLLDAAAARYGGTVRSWQGAPDEGYWELYTTADTLDIVIPPVARSFSQSYELWTGGTTERRCDGETEAISGEACLCDAEDRECQITTRVQVMLPDLPGLGVWRLESHGYNVAAKLPATIELLKSMRPGAFIPAQLRLVANSKRVRLPNGKTQTHRWMEPELHTPESIGELLTLAAASTIPALGDGNGNGMVVPPTSQLTPGPSRPPAGQKVDRPALGPAPALPEQAAFRQEDARPAPAAAPAPKVVSGWEVDEGEAEPPKPPLTPVKAPRKPRGKPRPEPEQPEPLSIDAWRVKLGSVEIPTEHAQAVMKRRFPTVQRVAHLTDEQRGRLWDEIVRTLPAKDAPGQPEEPDPDMDSTPSAPPAAAPAPPPDAGGPGLTADQLREALTTARVAEAFARETAVARFGGPNLEALTDQQRYQLAEVLELFAGQEE